VDPEVLDLKFERVQPSEIEELSEILIEAADWLASRDIALWALEKLQPEVLRPAVQDG